MRRGDVSTSLRSAQHDMRKYDSVRQKAVNSSFFILRSSFNCFFAEFAQFASYPFSHTRTRVYIGVTIEEKRTLQSALLDVHTPLCLRRHELRLYQPIQPRVGPRGVDAVLLGQLQELLSGESLGQL